jgi:hypothetical protein
LEGTDYLVLNYTIFINEEGSRDASDAIPVGYILFGIEPHGAGKVETLHKLLCFGRALAYVARQYHQPLVCLFLVYFLYIGHFTTAGGAPDCPEVD